MTNLDKIRIEFEDWWLQQEELLINSQEVASWFISKIQDRDASLLKEVEGKRISYEKGVEICEKTSYPNWKDHKYCCHYKKGFNKALDKVLQIIKSRI